MEDPTQSNRQFHSVGDSPPISPGKKTLNKRGGALSTASLQYGSSASIKKSGSQVFSQYHSISEIHSASTLQHSSLLSAFPKAERFPPIKSIQSFTTPLELPSTLKKGATSFGFGNKIVMSEAFSKHAKHNPAPCHYTLKSDFSPEPGKGKTFGLSHAAYVKTYMPNMVQQPPEVARNFPGPGEYKVDEEIGSKKKTTTLKSRVKWFFEENRSEAPPSNFYTPAHAIVEPSRFHAISLGLGNRYDFTKNAGVNPGPGAYTLPSVFDRFHKGERNVKKKTEKSPGHRTLEATLEKTEDE
jgi:hypothetical protein